MGANKMSALFSKFSYAGVTRHWTVNLVFTQCSINWLLNLNKYQLNMTKVISTKDKNKIYSKAYLLILIQISNPKC